MCQIYAPIALFVYCRPDHVKKNIEALLANREAKDTDLYIFSDAPKNEKAKEGVAQTREYIHTIAGFKSVTIFEREVNWGLAKSLINGISQIVEQYGRVSVVEDDIIAAPYFLKYMNDGLEKYKDEPKVASIHAYSYPHKRKLPDTFFVKGADCWGWATWKRAWDVFTPDAAFLYSEIVKRKLQREFDFNFTFPYMCMLKDQIKGKVSSWAICWYASAFLNDMYTLYPNVSMAKQIGMDGQGATHSVVTNKYEVEVNQNVLCLKDIPIENSREGVKMFQEFFMTLKNSKGVLKRFIKIINSKFNYFLPI